MKYISLVVTTYNKEKYIGKCLNSIVNQNLNSCEVIIIDDGSTDGTKKICDKFVQKYDYFKIFSQKNNGVSSARNKGIELAKGEYITFIDGDDYLSPNYIKKMLKGKEYDLVQSGFNTIKEDEVIPDDLSSKVVSGLISIIDQIFKRDLFRFFSVPWAKIFKTNIIKKNNIRFPEQSFGEDTIFVMDYLKYIDTLKMVNFNGYNNVILDNTLSRKKIKNIWVQLMNILNSATDDFNFEYSNYWNFLYLRNIKLMLLNSMNNFSDFKESCHIIENDSEFSKIEIKKNDSIKEKVLICILKFRWHFMLYCIFKIISKDDR